MSAALSFNFFHTVPYLTLEIDSADDVETTLLLLAVGLAVGQLASCRRHPSIRGEKPADEIRRIHRVATVGEPGRHTSADMIQTAQNQLTELLTLRSCQFEAFPFTHPLPRLERSGVVAVMEYRGPDSGFALPADGAELPVTVKELNAGLVLALDGPSIAAEDLLILNAFADQLAAVLEHGRLRVEAGRAHALADANELRGALLQAVSHDLRTPQASIKACATSLKNHDVSWSDQETAEFVDTIGAETDRLTALVGNLLDMSRVQAGGAGGAHRSCAAGARDPQRRRQRDRRHRRRRTGLRRGDGDRRACRDPCRRPGAGVPAAHRGRMFQPFQRLGDSSPGGVGLGLAVAHGFLTAMGATIELDDTPGGGTTVMIGLPTS